MKRGKQRARFHIERSVRHLPYSAGDSHAVQFLKSEGLQNQNVERALQQILIQCQPWKLLSIVYKSIISSLIDSQ